MGWLLAILAGGYLTFNAVVTPDKAAFEATKALEKKFPGAQVQVKIEGKRGKDVLNGRFRKIDIDLANLTLEELPIEAGAAPQSAPVAAANNATSAPAAVREPNGSLRVGAPRAQSAPQFKSVEIEAPKPKSNQTKAAKPQADKAKLGRTDELNIVVRDFKWQKLPVERADFHFADVEYDFGALKNRSEFKLVRLGGATMHLELAPDSLTPFIAKRVADVSNPRVIMSGDQISVNGARNFYGLSAPFEVKGQPGFAGSQVILKSPKLLVSGLAVPALVATPILQSVNPLYSFDDLEGLPFTVNLTKVESRDGRLQIDGDLSLKR